MGSDFIEQPNHAKARPLRWLFANLLPFSNVAARVALGSAVAGALACGLVALMVSRAGSLLLENMPAFTRHVPADQNLLRVVCGFVAGTVLGLSRPVWRVAVIVETWALSLLLFTLIFGLLLRWIATPQRKRFLYAACFAFGLLGPNASSGISAARVKFSCFHPATLLCWTE